MKNREVIMSLLPPDVDEQTRRNAENLIEMLEKTNTVGILLSCGEKNCPHCKGKSIEEVKG